MPHLRSGARLTKEALAGACRGEVLAQDLHRDLAAEALVGTGVDLGETSGADQARNVDVVAEGALDLLDARHAQKHAPQFVPRYGTKVRAGGWISTCGDPFNRSLIFTTCVWMIVSSRTCA